MGIEVLSPNRWSLSLQKTAFLGFGLREGYELPASSVSSLPSARGTLDLVFCSVQKCVYFNKTPDVDCAQVPPWKVFLRISLWSNRIVPLIQVNRYRTQHAETPVTHNADGVTFFSEAKNGLYWLVVSMIRHDVTFDCFLLPNPSTVHSEFII